MSQKTSTSHGGKCKGAGRKKKTLTSPVSSSVASTQTQSINSTSTVPSVFFANQNSILCIPGIHELHHEPEDSQSSPEITPGMITNIDFDRLHNEVEEVMNNDEHAEVRIQEGRIIDESISDTMDDSAEVNAEAAEVESNDSEAKEHSVNHQYLTDYRNSLRKQITKYRMPKCYKDGQFFIQPPHPVFALHHAACTSLSPDPLCLCPIFVWLPEYLPGHPDSYKCECGGHLTMNGCGVSYQGSSPHILAQLPCWVQEAFPARYYRLSGREQVPDFPKFDDAMKYAGSAPSIRYMKSIWTDYHSGIKIYADRVQTSLSGYKLAGNHTFRVMKAMARLKSEPTFAALFSLVNEWEEIRAQAMALTKGFSILPEMFKQVSVGLKEHGHQPTALYYCDNPTAERDFHERVTESLRDGVQHIINKPGKNLPKFKLDPRTVAIEYFDNSMLINNVCEEILESMEQLSISEQLVVGLSVCCISGSEILKSIQLRMPEKILIFQVIQLHAENVPTCLRSFLTSPRIIKAGRLAKVKGVANDPCASPSLIVLAVLKKRYSPIPVTFTETPPSEEDTHALATEAECAWQTYVCMSQQGSVAKRLQKGLFLSIMAQRTLSWMKMTLTSVKITPAYSLIQIDKVLVPGSLLSKHSQTVQWMFDHDPLSNSILGIPALPPAFPIEPDPELAVGSTQQIIDHLQGQLGDGNEALDEEDDHNGGLIDGEVGSENLAYDIEEDEPTASEEIIVNSLQYCQALLVQHAEESQTLPTRVFDDIFHFMDRLLRTLPKSHSAFKEFSHLFSETILIRDSNNVKAVKAVLEKKDIPWSYAVHSKKDWLNCHVRRYVPEPQKLEADLQRLFSSFEGVICSSDRKKGRGCDQDGLTLYRTIQGTNSIEGGGRKWSSHFDIWLTDEIVELAISVDSSPSFRIPSMLSTRIATSESFGIIPIPTPLAQEYNITTLPLRRIEGVPHHRDVPAHLFVHLSTNIISPYRYLQLFQRTIYPVIPVHTRAKFTEFKRFLGLAGIRNNCSSVPHSQAWKGIDYIKFAQLWNLKVETQDPGITDSNERLYYKLPKQLQRHHKKSLEWQTSRATMSLGSNVVKVQGHLETLADPEQVANVLPAIPLEDTNIQCDPTVDGLLGLDLTLFNPMALQRTDIQGRAQFDADFRGTTSTEPPEDTATMLPPIHDETEPAIPSQAIPETRSSTQPGIAQYQATLSFGSALTQQTSITHADAKKTLKRKKRGCAVCRGQTVNGNALTIHTNHCYITVSQKQA
ncbi:hypothetical protein BDP27DRAFT_1374097 [Rhodocollybia butyracea]|uniref:Uncharacterized protein n=1 Tax=Rhodocollybia butyracea TaxID=206335 RepID=A0A9P5TWS0_9AGAR|nr:hypothetical protein BDP27DRAFT_1374097 [Rhodocollybia butyracea]